MMEKKDLECYCICCGKTFYIKRCENEIECEKLRKAGHWLSWRFCSPECVEKNEKFEKESKKSEREETNKTTKEATKKGIGYFLFAVFVIILWSLFPGNWLNNLLFVKPMTQTEINIEILRVEKELESMESYDFLLESAIEHEEYEKAEYYLNKIKERTK